MRPQVFMNEPLSLQEKQEMKAEQTAWTDMQRRNTELVEENRKLKEQLEQTEAYRKINAEAMMRYQNEINNLERVVSQYQQELQKIAGKMIDVAYVSYKAARNCDPTKIMG